MRILSGPSAPSGGTPKSLIGALSTAYPKRSAIETTAERLPVLLTATVLFLLVAVVGATAALGEADANATSAGLPTSEDIIGAIESGNTDSSEPNLTDPSAAEGVPLRDLGREEALELLQGVFASELQSPAGIFDELEVEKFLAPNVAVVPGEVSAGGAGEAQEGEATPQTGEEPEGSGAEGDDEQAPALPPSEAEKAGSQPASAREEAPPISDRSGEAGKLSGATLLQSTVPLRVESQSGEQKAVDLSLEHAEGELQPANPLVEVGIPKELSEGIELPEVGVRIELAGAPKERSPSTLDSSVAVYPNVATDTDLAVAPSPTGVETLTQIRSAESPLSQTFNLSLPAGATLEATKEGGAVVTRGEETLIGIAPPSALDGAGEEVPVRLEVSGDLLILSVEPGESAKYPLLLDPLFQTYEWEKSSNPGMDGICNNSIEYVKEESPPFPAFECGPGEEWRSKSPFHKEVPRNRRRIHNA